MSSVVEELRTRVAKSPRDREACSVYADALLQAGDSRGTFITLQQHLEGPLPPDKREAATLQAEALLKAHRADWFGLALGWAEIRVRGGFIRALRSPAGKFVANASKLLAVEPVLDVTLTSLIEQDLIALAALPELACIGELSLVGRCSDKAAAALAASPHATKLASLNFNGGAPKKAFASAAANLRELETFVATGTGMGDDAVSMFARLDLPKLARLYLARNELSDSSMGEIASGRALTNVTKLCLGGNEITDEGAEALAEGSALTHVAHLELNGNEDIGSDGANAIVKSKKLGALRKLDLRECAVTKTQRRPGLTVFTHR